MQQAVIDYGQDAELVGTHRKSPPLLASGLAGTITAIQLQPGVALTNGSELYHVDAIRVVAYVADAVFYRALSEGDTGPDVVAAQRLINALLGTQRVPENGRFGPSMTRAVQEYAKNIGADPSSTEFAPEWFVRLPHDNYVIEGSSLRLGAPAPSRGGEVAFEFDALASVELRAPEPSPDGRYLFVSEGRQLEVVREQDQWAVADMAAAAQLLGPPSAEGDSTSISGFVRLIEPEAAQALPPAALVANADSGSSCVVVVAANGYDATPVDLHRSVSGDRALIRPSLPADTVILVNPAEVAGDVGCP